MSSAVFFKFRSSKEPQRVTFDGTGISVFELKRDIIRISGLGDGTDFDLLVYNADSNEGESFDDSQKSKSSNFGVEYDDDTTVLSRGTTVVARRMPALKPGAGRAARYVSGKMPVNAKNHHRIEASKTASAVPSSNSAGNLPTNASEDDKIAAMFNQGDQQWQEQQAQMANQKAIHRTGYVKPNQAVPDKPLPAGYTCHRCGERGHWIQACPTNNDPTFDNRPKFKKTTGIPKSFLKTVDKPPALSSDGTVDMSQLPAGVMYTAEGEWVVAMPDSAAWEQYQAKTKASAEKAQSSEANATLQEWGLECPIDKRMFVDPVKTPCCSKTFCRNCIETALFDSDFVCPSCETSGVLVDDLVEDDETIEKIKEFVEFEAKEKDKPAKEQSDEKPDEKNDEKKALADAASPAAEEGKVGTPSGENKDPGAESSDKGSPKPTTEEAVGTPGSTTTSVNGSKKRAASDELENKRIPTAPKAMMAEQQTQKTQQEQLNEMAKMAASMGFPGMDPMMMATMFSGMGGFPNMNMNMGMGFPMMNNMGMGFNNGAGNMGFNNNMNFNNQNMGFGMQNQFQQGMMPQQNGQANMNGGGNGAYMRQPVNAGRGQNRNRNQQQRSVDYRELGS